MKLRAIKDFFSDLFSGDPVALGIAGFFLILILLVGGVWLAHWIKLRRKADARKTKRKKS